MIAPPPHLPTTATDHPSHALATVIFWMLCGLCALLWTFVIKGLIADAAAADRVRQQLKAEHQQASRHQHHQHRAEKEEGLL